jgi:hypothetical protein
VEQLLPDAVLADPALRDDPGLREALEREDVSRRSGSGFATSTAKVAAIFLIDRQGRGS